MERKIMERFVWSCPFHYYCRKLALHEKMGWTSSPIRQLSVSESTSVPQTGPTFTGTVKNTLGVRIVESTPK
jgi:hypothetical protein